MFYLRFFMKLKLVFPLMFFCFFVPSRPVMIVGCCRGRRLWRGSTAWRSKSLRTWRPDWRRPYWAPLGLVRRWCAAAEVSSTEAVCVGVGVWVVFIPLWFLYSTRKESLQQPGECQVEEERHSLETKYRPSRQVCLRELNYLFDFWITI